MITLLQLIAITTIVIGTLFSILGVIGFWRFPDVYTRLHATGKVGVFGVVLLLLATAAALPSSSSRVLVLVAMLLLVGPVSAHALASAAHRLGIPMHNVQRNDLTK